MSSALEMSSPQTQSLPDLLHSVRDFRAHLHRAPPLATGLAGPFVGGVDPAVGGAIHRTALHVGAGRLRVGVEGDKHFSTALMGIADAGVDGGFAKFIPAKLRALVAARKPR